MPRPPRYVFAPNTHDGFSLIEAVIGAALICGLSLALYNIFQPASSSATVKHETVRLDSLRHKVTALYITSPDFSGIGQDPSVQADAQNAPWGGLAVSSADIQRPVDGWAATYRAIPVDACNKLTLSQLGDLWTSISVDGHPITSGPSAMALCSQGETHTVRFAAWGGLRAGAKPLAPLWGPGGAPTSPPAVGVPMPPAPPCVPSTQTRTTSTCPPGQLGNVTEVQTATCPSPTGPSVWGPWTVTASTCAPACVPPPAQTQPAACPSGQISAAAPYSVNGMTLTRSATCPTPTGPSVWGPWVLTGNNCVPACLPPPAQTGVAACPAGQISAAAPYSVNGLALTRSATCPVPTGQSVWGPWAVTGSTCAPVCSPPAAQTQPAPCPSGQLSSVSPYSINGVTQKRTASCPLPVGAFVWSAWANASSTCVAKCSAPGPSAVTELRWDPTKRSAACPAGQTGSHTWTQQQQRTDTTNYSCTTPVGPLTSGVTYSAWVDTATRSGEVNTCAAPPPSGPPSTWQCRDALAPDPSSWTGHGPNGACSDTSTATNCIALHAPVGNSIWLHHYNPGKGFDDWKCGCVGDSISTGGSSATYMGRFSGPGNGVPAGKSAAFWKCP